MYAVAEEGFWIIWLVLLFASAGVLDHSGIKVPFFSFFAHDQGLRCKEAPMNMLLAMAITAAACVLIGVFPSVLYQWLPHQMNFTHTRLITSSPSYNYYSLPMLAFVVLFRNGWYPAEIRSVNLDTDWFYRKPLNSLVRLSAVLYRKLLSRVQESKQITMRRVTKYVYEAHGPTSPIARGASVGNMVVWVAVLLSACLMFYYF